MTEALYADALAMAAEAWRVRDHAHIYGDTKVGCAVRTVDGLVVTGCNVEHRFRCHDIHAEVNAIGNLVASGCKSISIVIVVAERERFTPCGSCMDWIMQFGEKGCLVGFQGKRGGEVDLYTTDELMPHYPR